MNCDHDQKKKKERTTTQLQSQVPSDLVERDSLVDFPQWPISGVEEMEPLWK